MWSVRTNRDGSDDDGGGANPRHKPTFHSDRLHTKWQERRILEIS